MNVAKKFCTIPNSLDAVSLKRALRDLNRRIHTLHEMGFDIQLAADLSSLPAQSCATQSSAAQSNGSADASSTDAPPPSQDTQPACTQPEPISAHEEIATSRRGRRNS